MRVLHVLERGLSTSKLRQVGRLANGLQKADVSSTIVCLTHTRSRRPQLQSLVPNREPHVCLQTAPFNLTLVPKFAKQLKNAAPDIVHYWGSSVSPALAIANRLTGNLPLVATASTNQHQRSMPWWQSGMTFVAETNSETLPTANRSQIHYVPPGICTSSSPPTTRNETSLRTRLGLNNVRLIAACTDLLIQNHGKDLIWALDCLRVLHTDTHLVFFGEGNYRDELIDFSKRVGPKSGVVHFIDDAGMRLPNWLRECECFWQADPAGNAGSILEAMAARVPVIATESTEASVLLDHGETGFLVPPRDAAEFARRANILFSAPLHRERVVRKAHAYITQNHSFDEMLRSYLQIYRRLRTNIAVDAA